MSKLDEFKDLDAALAGFALGEEGVRPAHACGDFPLRQAGFFTGGDQFLEKSVVFPSEGGGAGALVTPRAKGETVYRRRKLGPGLGWL